MLGRLTSTAGAVVPVAAAPGVVAVGDVLVLDGQLAGALTALVVALTALAWERVRAERAKRVGDS